MKLSTFVRSSLVIWFIFQCIQQCANTSIKDKITGITTKVLDKYINAYLGIPYATPPVGDLRFSEPQPVKDWDFVYNATQKSNYCMQDPINREVEWANIEGKELNEDCLYINIWVPTSKTCGESFATMVWIHGGGFNVGSANMDIYDGAVIASIGNVIVVSFNYRIGAFGYANFDSENAAVNAGMLDQVMALKWVHQNIEYFGGNKDLITIFGESAGSMSVANHLISPMTKGLFKRAILQSGSNYHELFTVKPKNNIELTSMLSKELGCSEEDTLKCMRNANPFDIAAAELKLMQRRQVVLSFLPQKGSPFLPEDPFQSIDDGKFHDVDILIGATKDEGSVFLRLQNLELINEEKPILSKSESLSLLSKIFTKDGESLNRIVQEYLGNVADDDTLTIVKQTIKAIGDAHFMCPILHLTEKLSKNNRNVFHYIFNHTRIKSPIKKWIGVPHFEDIYFVFGMPFVDGENYEKEELQFSKKIIQAWTSFAKTGKPSYDGMEQEWSEFGVNERRSLSLSLQRFHLARAEEEKCNFWKQFYGYN
ncbi:cholinesterase-like isoform X2 [Centruroides sculpturatus]|nr:cholinesterase-like isoform X2 [Centruroides sculpturatus]